MYDTVEKFREYLKDTKYINDGIQHVYQFPNNYGASVVKHDFSYGGKNGLWELAVLDYSIDKEGDLCYTSGITDDVIGHLTWKNVEEFLLEIKKL